MIDTGSAISAMNKQAAQLFYAKRPAKKTEQPIQLGNGTIDVLTQKYEPMITIDKRPQKMTLFVIPNLQYNILLGMDFARLFNMEIIFGDHPTIETPFEPMHYIEIPTDDNDVELTEKQQQKWEDLQEQYKDQLAEADAILGATDTIEHDIITPDETPIRQQPYRVSPKQKEAIKQQIEELLKLNVIRPSKSPYASPVVLVDKPDGTLRMCIDFRQVNNVTTGDAHPLPKIDELLDQLGKTRVFSTLDLLQGFHQIKLTENAIPKTAFTTHLGLFEYTRMPFGLKNAPATFQRLVEDIFRDIMWINVLVYIDDIIIFTETVDQHLEVLKTVLNKLKRHQLQAKRKKCKFFKRKLTFLGHTVSPEGLLPKQENIKTLQEFKDPSNLKELRSFLGMASYYRKFVPNYSKISRPLTKLLKEDEPFVIGKEQKETIQILKDKLTKPPILKFPDYSKTFHVITDASKERIGHVICQQYDKKFHPIRYGGKQLNKAEQNYTTSEKEALALLHAIKKNHAYLHGRRFVVHTDHLPLKSLLNAKDPTGRLARWFLTFQNYDFDTIYLPGKDNVLGDAVSRLNQHHEQEEKLKHFGYINIPGKLKQMTSEDREMQELIEEIKTTPSKYPKLTIDEGQIFFNDKDKPRRLMLPKQAQAEITRSYHDSPYSSHYGINTTVRKLEQRYYWPTMRQDITFHINNCKTCNATKGTTKKAQISPFSPGKPFEHLLSDIMGPLKTTKNGNKYIITLMDRATSWIEAFPLPSIESTQIADILIDEWITRYGTPRTLLTDHGTNYMSKMMTHLYERLGIEKLQTSPYHPSSNGKIERMNKVIADGLRHYVNTNQNDWDEHLTKTLHALRSTPTSTTGKSPYEMMFGQRMTQPKDTELLPAEITYQNPDDRINLLNDELANIRDEAETNRLNQQSRFNKDLKDQDSYEIGEYVWLQTGATKGKLAPKFSGPHKIINKPSTVLYQLETPSGQKLKHPVHFDRLKIHNGTKPKETEKAKGPPITEEKWQVKDLENLKMTLRKTKETPLENEGEKTLGEESDEELESENNEEEDYETTDKESD